MPGRLSWSCMGREDGGSRAYAIKYRLRGLRTNGTKTYVKKLTHCLNWKSTSSFLPSEYPPVAWTYNAPAYWYSRASVGITGQYLYPCFLPHDCASRTSVRIGENQIRLLLRQQYQQVTTLKIHSRNCRKRKEHLFDFNHKNKSPLCWQGKRSGVIFNCI